MSRAGIKKPSFLVPPTGTVLPSPLQPRELLAGIAHDLKAPISTIVTSAELLEEELDAGMSNHLVSIIERQTERLHVIVQDLSQYFSVGSKTLLIHPESIDYSELVRETCADLQAAQATHKLDVRLPASRIFVRADYSKVRRILENLVLNAFKYSPPSTYVLASLRLETDDTVVLEVEDEGPGIAEEDRTRIFEPFVRLEASSTKGQGLGLNIVKELAAAHGGRSWVEPISSGGSRFCVALPALNPQSSSNSEFTSASTPHSA